MSDDFSVDANDVLRDSVLFKVFDCDRLIGALQLTSEINRFMNLLSKLKLTKVLEIGTCDGGTLYAWTKVAEVGAKIITIDLPDTYTDSNMQIFESFGVPKQQNIHLVRGDSHSSKTIKMVNDILNGDKLDFLFIDGDHSYKGIKQDFEMYSPLVKKGGIISMHDIVLTERNEVPIFWNEIKKNYKYEEIMENPNQHGYGIGIIEAK